MKRNKRIIAGMLGCILTAACIQGGFSVTDHALAVSQCVIDTTAEYQTIRGFGGINHPEWIGDLTESQRQTAFGNGDEELGLSILRVFVNDNEADWYKAVPTALAAQEQGALIFASPWNPPADMCEMFDRDGDSSNGNEAKRLRHDKYAEYADHLNRFVQFMEENGVEIYSISIQNEPDYGAEWTWWTSDECIDFIVNYSDAIDCRVMSPETFQYNKEYYNAILNNSEAFDRIDVFGTHFYGTARSSMDFPALETCGKEIWMTEVYVPNSDQNSADRWPEALQVSENIHNGLAIGNMSAYTWWYIRRHYGPMKDDGTISKRGYCMAQYSKFVRPDDVRIAATEQPASNVYVSAYKGDDGQITIVALNMGTEAVTQDFSIGSTESITDVDSWRTSGTENLAAYADLAYEGSDFTAELPAESVTTFVVSIEGEGVPVEKEEPDTDENGYYIHDTFEEGNCGWGGRGAATAEAVGHNAYAGNQALTVYGRTSKWHGTCKELDTTIFEPGNAYSFSVCVRVAESAGEDTIALTLQYNDASGVTQYANIASAAAIPGEYVQLTNTAYTIPADASGMVIYVETTNSTTDFMIDEFIAAPAGTIIGSVSEIIVGDVNADGKFTVADVVALQKWLLAVPDAKLADWKAGDLCKDDRLDVFDLCLMKRELLKKI